MTVNLRQLCAMPIRLALDPAAAKSFATTLRAHGFDAERLSNLLGFRGSAPLDTRNAALAHRCDSSGPLGTLARLFVLGLAVPIKAAAEAFAPDDPAALMAAGLLVSDNDNIIATIQIQTFGPYLVASDRMDWRSHPDFVLQLTESARLLASAAWFPSTGRVLDLGCGAGLLSVIASDLGAQVVATDNNPRAAMFTDFNANLNDVQVETRVGHLFDTVTGEQFDLIIANLPFIIAPDGNHPSLSSPLFLDELCRSFALLAPDHLVADGSCQFLAGWPQMVDSGSDDRVLSWFRDFQGDVWIMVFQQIDIAEYSALYLDTESDLATEYVAWIQYFAELSVERVLHGIITMNKSAKSSFQVATHDLSAYDSPFRDHLLGVFEARKRASSEGYEGLLGAVLEVGDGVHFVAEHEAGSDGFDAIRVEKRSGVHGVFGIDPIVYAFLNACDGSRSLHEAAGMGAAASGQELSRQMLDGMVSVALECLYSGVLQYSHSSELVVAPTPRGQASLGIQGRN